MSRLICHSGSVLNFFLVTVAATVNVLFGLLKFINSLDIRFYYLYSPRSVNIVVFSPTVDFWIWIVSLLFIVLEMLLMMTSSDFGFPRWTILPLIILLVSLAVFPVNSRLADCFIVPLGFLIIGLSIYYGDGYLVARGEDAAIITCLCITGLLIFFELASASSWVYNVFDYEVPFGSTLRWRFPSIDLQLFNLPYPLTSWLFLILLYSWLWIPASKYILSKVKALRHILPRIERSSFSPIQNIDSGPRLNNKYVTLGLLISLAAAISIAYYPYIHLPNSTLVGSDSVDYYYWLKEMMQKGPLTAFDGDRPFFNLLMYSVKYATGSTPETAIRIMPIVLNICLSLAVFWFVKVGTRNELVALMSSLFSSFSFQTTVGVFASYLANWFAIIEIFILMVFMLKSFEKNSWKYILASALIGMAVLLTHPYTWNVLIAILAFYLLWIFLRRKSEEKPEIALLTLLLVSNLMFYAVYVSAPYGKGVSHAEGTILQDVTSSISISNFLNLQNGLASMVQIWVGGLFANPLLVILALAGIFSMYDLPKNFNRIMLLWVMVPSLALLTVSPYPFYHRLVYIIPIQIQAAAGLYWILNKLEYATCYFKTSKTCRALRISTVILVGLFLLNYSLRSVDEAIIHIL